VVSSIIPTKEEIEKVYRQLKVPAKRLVRDFNLHYGALAVYRYELKGKVTLVDGDSNQYAVKLIKVIAQVLNRQRTFLYIASGGWSENEAAIRKFQESLLGRMTWVASVSGGAHLYRTHEALFDNLNISKTRES